MKQIKKGILIFIMLLSLYPLQAQEELQAQDETDYYRSITLVPQYLFINGIRIDFERRITNRHWLQVCPQVYLRENSGGIFSANYDKITGAGILLYHKIYLNKKTDKRHGLYFSYGGGYNYYSMTYTYRTGYDYINNVTTQQSGNTEINAISGQVIVGLQRIIHERILLDFYTGLCHTYSFRKLAMDETNTNFNMYKFKSNPADYGYSGNTLLLGIKLGFLF